MTSEMELLRWLQEQLPNLTDDVAELPAGAWIATTDHQIPGVHLPEATAPEIVAERLLRVSLSDLAAGGAQPRFAFSNLAAPAGYPLKQFLRGLLGACQAFDVELAGGDTSSAPQPVFSLTLLGELPENGRSPARGNAEPGDRLWLSGTVGQSRLGREVLQVGIDQLPPDMHEAAEAALERHLRPQPHLEIGQWLATQTRAAAIDISDGLALDLHRLCDASGVGATLDGDALPLTDDHAALAAALTIDPFEAALGGGEDYVLLFSLPAEVEPLVDSEATAIGSVAATREVELRTDDGVRSIEPAGWDHFA